MAFSITDAGSIVEDFTNSLNEAFGGEKGAKFPGIKGSLLVPNKNNYGITELVPSRWTGNAYSSGTGRLLYGFSILPLDKNNLKGKITFNEGNTFFLQTAPQSIQQKEIFATNIQATRKGVIVESEGIVFKDIIITGNTGIFPGERGGSNTSSPNFSNFTSPPSPPSGVNVDGGSTRTGVTTITGYSEFLLLREFFMDYARQKVEKKGKVFFSFLNQKDNQYLVVEPLEFTMDRNAKSPLTYDYRIVLRAIAKIDAVISTSSEESPASLLEDIANVSANVIATIDSANEIINNSIGLLLGITQALDNTFLKPIQQLQQALTSISNGISTVLSLPATLAANAENVSDFDLAVANARDSLNSSVNNFGISQGAQSLSGGISSTAAEITTDDQGNVTGTGSSSGTLPPTAQDASTINGKVPNILNDDGTLSSVLTPQQFIAVQEVINKLENDPLTPLPRSFVEALRANVVALRDDLSDSIGAGDDFFNEIYGRIVTKPPSPLATPTTSQISVLGAFQDIIAGLDKILANNEFFQAEAEELYADAQETYGQISDINRPDNVREVLVEFGDTLERIALREYGDALRWVDLVILNKLRSPYIINTSTEAPDGVLIPGDKILVGNV